MNSADICHRILDLDIFVDSFQGHYLRNQTKNSDNTFILSHYHGDHYQQLPRDNKYQGPALIHCSHVTARLLIEVHKVQERFVVGHDYGSTFHHCVIKQGVIVDNIKVTFYDANHCPGACIILISSKSEGTTHLHTGDMRYHPRFQSYPLLQRAVQQRKIDLVYLDTTYCHPKHNFSPQEEAVESIASQTEELLSGNYKCINSKNTLVLLSCYSIGKEKVLYEASKRSEQLMYVSEKKWKMLECIQQKQSQGESGFQSQHQFQKEEDTSSPSLSVSPHHLHQQKYQHRDQQHTNILDRCTRDPTLSDLHVISMGLAGEMFPFFRPNFQKIANYVEELSCKESAEEIPSLKEKQRYCREYDKVVAFIPTGWANASNWNKKNAISTKKVQLSSSASLHVEVRLISYSEHSAFSELVSFVEYLKPRKIIPTVFSDQKHYRQIENRFRSMVDSTRVKQAFFRSMIKTDTTETLLAPGVHLTDDKDCHNRNDKSDSIMNAYDNGEDKSNEEIEIVEANNPPLANNKIYLKHDEEINDDKINTIVTMGFDKKRAEVLLEKCHGNVQLCIGKLLSEGVGEDENHYQKKETRTSSSHSNAVKKRKAKSSTGMISDYFAHKKK